MTGDWYDVDELIARIAAAIYNEHLGLLTVSGLLVDWTTRRYGTATAELVNGDAHLRLYADKHTAKAITDGFADVGYDPHQPAAAIARGHITMHPRWGLRLMVTFIDLEDLQPAERPVVVDETNKTRPWPPRLDVIGVVDPAHGDAGRGDLLESLADCDLTIIEHRVPVTGRHAPGRIARALDHLANDHRPDLTVIIRGGGPGVDLDVFNHPHVLAAIARHPRPIVTGIGHATDHTHADTAAHTACITPTAAATVIGAHHRRSSFEP